MQPVNPNLNNIRAELNKIYPDVYIITHKTTNFHIGQFLVENKKLYNAVVCLTINTQHNLELLIYAHYRRHYILAKLIPTIIEISQKFNYKITFDEELLQFVKSRKCKDYRLLYMTMKDIVHDYEQTGKKPIPEVIVEKKKRGRPKKIVEGKPLMEIFKEEDAKQSTEKRKRGRPKKDLLEYLL